MPAMVSPWSLYIPAACGRNALIGDDAQAVTDVPHRGTHHVRRCTVRKRHGKHQPRRSTKKNAPHSAACHTMSTQRTDACKGARRAARCRLRRSAVPAAATTAPLPSPPRTQTSHKEMAKKRTTTDARIPEGQAITQHPLAVAPESAPLAPPMPGLPAVRPTHNRLLPVPVSHAAPRCCACAPKKNRLPGHGVHDNVSGRLSTKPAGNRVCRVQRGGYVVQLQCPTLPP